MLFLALALGRADMHGLSRIARQCVSTRWIKISVSGTVWSGAVMLVVELCCAVATTLLQNSVASYSRLVSGHDTLLVGTRLLS